MSSSLARPSAPLASRLLSGIGQPLPVMLIYIAAVFLLGGASRDDVLSLALLRPLSVVVLGYALVVADPAALRANRALLALAAAWTALAAVQLVPLPPALWQALPGRELAAEIDRAAGLAGQWRPLSLVPHRTLNALLSLTVPLAALMLALRLTRAELRTTVIALIAMGMVSAGIGLLQVIGAPGNGFYLYRITNPDSAVGLFANRNHHAVMLALVIALLGAAPAMLADRVARAQRPMVRAAALGLALMLLPFLIVTQSRSGLVLGALALGACFWLLRDAASGPTKEGAAGRTTLLAGALGAVTLAALTWLLTAGNALERLARTGSGDDELRWRIWGPTLEAAWAHWPVGTGLGTFVEVYQRAEPASTLGPSYINRAHNDWLEVVLTGGLPALAILLCALVWLGWASRRALVEARGSERVLRRTGLIALALCALGSLYDYPLRTPALAIVFILALVWIAGNAPQASHRERAGRADDPATSGPRS